MELPELSIRERLRYKDISWLMPSVDVVDALERLGVKVKKWSGKEVEAFCPDHHLYTGRKPSHPTWSCNTDTGETYCFTEGRGSNLVWIARRMLECNPEEAAKFLTGSKDVDMSSLRLAGAKMRISRMRKGDAGEPKESVKGLDNISDDMKKRYVSPRLYDFFISPPGKTYPTNITQKTVDQYQVFERTWGRYVDRAIIPIHMKQELVGFCAIDLLGIDEWLKKHPSKTENDYRKTLFPLNFPASDCLFGFDECRQGRKVIVVEGVRERMKLTQEGYPDVVSIQGIRIHPPQIRLLSELSPKEVVLMFDGDEKGYKSTDEMAKIIGGVFNVRKCFLPAGRDPKTLESSNFVELLKKKVDKK